MIIRIVKLIFKNENISNFEEIFEASKEVIRGYEGCSLVELYQDVNDPCIFFTYSHWETEEHLLAYRKSDFFKEVWGRTKLLFDDRPEAWSVHKIHSLN
ncbi:putative quinol monooxygenase [Muriicola sp.]|uniref:putative quinol monooxygenase n=1 Tax=Muriicola sp. TaxID=2020856 RepID=UPI003C76CD90